MSDGPGLPPGLAARLGPQHDLQRGLCDFDVICSVRVESPNHIKIEEGVALLRYLRWVVRSAARFRHRVVLLVDSKVVLGAITKGRSSSKALNAIVRKAAALCFAGGIILHVVFISTKHNPSDWPSRGDASTWPAELRKRAYRPKRRSRCPACGVPPEDHPSHLPKLRRGQPASYLNCCAGRFSYAYDFKAEKWVSYHILYAQHMDGIDKGSDCPKGVWEELARILDTDSS